MPTREAEELLARITALREDAFHYYPQLARVQSYVSRHLDTPLTLSQVASVAGLEPHYFSTFFHLKVGISFRDWLALQRVIRALELLGRLELPLKQLAVRTGFGELRNLERGFQKWLGRTPRELRAALR